MHHQFKELADVDITKEPMEIGPTCHYVMGGVEVDPDTELSGVDGLYAVGECSGGMHGSNRLGGNSLSDLIVFGKRAGEAAASYASGLSDARLGRRATLEAAEQAALAPFDSKGDENPYTIQADLQQAMNDLVGIIRTADELEQSLKEIEQLKERAEQPQGRGRPRRTTPAGTSRSTSTTCCWSRSASRRRRWPAQESRGGHTRDDFPGPTRSGARRTWC